MAVSTGDTGGKITLMPQHNTVTLQRGRSPMMIGGRVLWRASVPPLGGVLSNHLLKGVSVV
jgi:hypothetical protein